MKQKYAVKQAIVSSLAAMAIGSPAIGLADDSTFQSEAGLTYSRSSFVGGHADVVFGQATYYFDKLPTSPNAYPLEQTPFVERIGSFSAGYGQSSLSSDSYQELSKGSLYNIAVDFAQPDEPLIARANYSSSYSGKSRYQSLNLEVESDSIYYDLAIGTYVGKTTAFVLDWSRDNLKTKNTSSTGSIDVKSTANTTGLSAQHLQQLSDDTHVAFTAGISKTSTDNSGNSPSYKSNSYKSNGVNLGGTYYPTKRLGLSLGMSIDRGDGTVGSQDTETYDVGARMFVTSKISLSLDYGHVKQTMKITSASNYDYNSHTVSLGASMRF